MFRHEYGAHDRNGSACQVWSVRGLYGNTGCTILGAWACHRWRHRVDDNMEMGFSDKVRDHLDHAHELQN